MTTSYIYGTVSSLNDADGSILTGKNNGNVGRIKYTISGTLQYSQTYQYDGVNRLSYGVEHNNGTLSDPNRAWYQTFAYDRWGNRGMTVASTSSNLNQGGNALELADFSSSTNRISETGYTFDNAGNLTAEPGSKSYEYDGENKIKKATVSSTDSYYWYDADGRRVKKVVGGAGTRFVYNAAGQLIAEYADAGSLTKEYIYKGGALVATIEPTDVVKYATADHLGTPRVWTNSSGGVVSRHDYAPFGEELFAGVGIRTTGANWLSSAQTDGQRKQFTEKERDTETGLDYFGARYYLGTQGRFLGVDNPKYSDKADPQTWNLYAYTSSNPVNRIDPDGRNWFYINGQYEWHEGNKHTYTDNKGKKQTVTSSYTHLVVIQRTGELNSAGAEKVKIALYGNGKDKILARGEGFTGATGIMKTPEGRYSINLNNRGEEQSVKVDRNTVVGAFHNGIQHIPIAVEVPPRSGNYVYPSQVWGRRRAHLVPEDGQDNNIYLHGKEGVFVGGGSATRGCACEPQERVLTTLFELNPNGVGEGNKKGRVAVEVKKQ